MTSVFILKEVLCAIHDWKTKDVICTLGQLFYFVSHQPRKNEVFLFFVFVCFSVICMAYRFNDGHNRCDLMASLLFIIIVITVIIIWIYICIFLDIFFI